MAQAAAAAEDDPPFVINGTMQDEQALTRTPEFKRAVRQLVTEDDTPVDSMFSETQQRLLTGALKDSWNRPGEGRPFIVAANVGVFRSPYEPPLVPDVFLSLDVRRPSDWWDKPGRSYLIWHYGKPPDVVIEVVSNSKGGEADAKRELYADFGVPYYVIFDPQERLKEGKLRAFDLTSTGAYAPRSPDVLPGTGLGLQLWTGAFESDTGTWLRWQDASGALILTAAEGRALEEDRADQAENRAALERARADQAERVSKNLSALLRAHGIEPESGE